MHSTLELLLHDGRLDGAFNELDKRDTTWRADESSGKCVVDCGLDDLDVVTLLGTVQ